MCLAVPGKIVSLGRDKSAVVSFSGVKQDVNVELIHNPRAGDWVTVHAGFAIGRLSKKEAKKTESLLEEMLSEKKDD